MNEKTLFSGIVLGSIGVILVVIIGFNIGAASVPSTPTVPTPTPRTPTPPTPTFTPTPRTPTATFTPAYTPTPTFTSTPTPTPTSTPTPIETVVLTPPRMVSRLTTAEQAFFVRKAIDEKPWWCVVPLCKNKFIFEAYGKVEAGIDLKKLKDSDFIIQGRSITVTLPPPEIFNDPIFDLEKSRIIDNNLNPIKVDPNIFIQLQREAQVLALEQVKQEGDLLRKTTENTEMQIELLLRRAGAENVTIRWTRRRF